ncbi:MAG TPA: serine hydrolase domain-containing protein, partial [Candidatus Eremiobacteraceae bacterium]|nr:serine hydrolase domain-containing protein [Candidatus Eremiobacteraceae bacterium]
MSAPARAKPASAPFSRALATLRAAEGRIFLAAVLHVRVRGDVVCEVPLGTLVPDGARVAPDTPFDLASVTKVFASTAMLALLDRRLVALDDPLVSVVPEFVGPDPRRAAVTFRHLLTHTSGLPAHSNLRDEASPRAILARVCAMPLEAAPGLEVRYSDLGFMLVGVAIERLLGKPLAQC